MRHWSRQTGKITVRQNPHDGHPSVDELREMVGHDSNALSNCVLHFGAIFVEHDSSGKTSYTNDKHPLPANGVLHT